MRFRICSIVVCSLVATACEGVFEPVFPPAAIAFTPPPEYRVWWEVVESCSGRQASYDAVGWFRVPGFHLAVKGESAAGVWFASSNRIALADGWRYNGSLVRHEMLHAVLRTGSHPTEYFHGACADEVICGRDCMKSTALKHAIQVSVDALEVDAALFPLEPSLGAYDGKATVVVRVRNPTNANAFVTAQRFSEASCAVGFSIASVSDPGRVDSECRYLAYNVSDARVYFRPGETRKLLFNVDLRAPTARGPFQAEPVTVSAIFADKFRGTEEVTIRP